MIAPLNIDPEVMALDWPDIPDIIIINEQIPIIGYLVSKDSSSSCFFRWCSK